MGWSAPMGTYGPGWFVAREMLTRGATTATAVVLSKATVIFWSMNDWQRMKRERPVMASELAAAVMRQLMDDKQQSSQEARVMKREPPAILPSQKAEGTLPGGRILGDILGDYAPHNMLVIPAAPTG